MKIRNRGLLYSYLLLMILALYPQVATAAPTHEESIVVQTYARLSYAVQLSTLYDAAINTKDEGEINNKVSAAEVRFQIKNMKSGELADIADLNYGDLVTKPNRDQALSIPIHTIGNGGSATSELAGMPTWITEQALQEDWNVPMSKAVPQIEQQNGGVHLMRYCRYTVRVSFAGKSRTYNGMFLFGQDVNGKEIIIASDTAVDINGQALTFFLTHNVRTDAITHGKVQNTKAVTNWISAHSGGIQ